MGSKNAECIMKQKKNHNKLTLLGRKHKITRHLSKKNPSVVTKDGRMYI